MYKECKSNQSIQRQKHISNCFCELLEQKEYEDITITELCEKAKLPRNTFYRYFASKNAILQYLLEDTLIEMLDTVMHMDADKGANEIDYLAYWLHTYRKYDSLWSIIEKGERHNMMLTQMIKYYSKLAGPSFKEDFNNLQTKQIIFLSYGTQGILDVWRHFHYEQSEKEVSKQLYQLFQIPMMNVQPTGKRIYEFFSKKTEQDFLFEEYKNVHK